MIIYSPLPTEQILDGWDRQETPVEMRAGGRVMEVMPAGEGQVRIVRLISPDPQDYLNPQWAPGQMVSWPASPDPS